MLQPLQSAVPITFFSDLLQVTHMIDNEGTVVFAMFMAIWGKCQCLIAKYTEPAAVAYVKSIWKEMGPTQLHHSGAF